MAEEMRVPLVGELKPDEDWAMPRFKEFLDSRMYVSGKFVEQFEAWWAKECWATTSRGAVVGVSSGTDALFIACSWAKLMGAQRVHTTPASFIATTEAALRAGLEVVYHDIDALTWCMFEPEGLSYREDVYLPVDLYGYPAPMFDHESFRPMVIVDSAQGHGIPIRERADVTCYSFYPTKNVGAVGMAGAVASRQHEMLEYARMMRSHGEGKDRFVYTHLSGNYRMDEFQAAMLLDRRSPATDAEERRKAARLYRLELDLLALDDIVPQEDHPNHVYHIFAVRVGDGSRRAALQSHLESKGIQTAVRYPVPLHLQPALRGTSAEGKPGDFPNAERWASSVLTLPMFPGITEQQIAYVVREIARFVRGQ